MTEADRDSAVRDIGTWLTRVPCETPAFVYSEAAIGEALARVSGAAKRCDCRVLFALKPFTFADALQLMVDRVSGFAASSLFEAKLARTVLDEAGTVHLTTPGLREEELAELCELCDYITFNSLPLWRRCRGRVPAKLRCGLRINPGLSFIDDARHDPCRPHSKLGLPLDQLTDVLDGGRNALGGLSGLHLHTNCDSSSFAPLLATVRHVESRLAPLLDRLEWLNLGGGYLFGEGADVGPFVQAVDLLRKRHGLEVFTEPGAAIVREAGYIVASVLDVFDSGGKTIAVLDTSVNHMPEVFEYQYQPEIVAADAGGDCACVLTGGTCLAGDLFGEYGFRRKLRVGSRIVFPGMGAYTLVKAHMFNGVNLPTIYALTETGELVQKRRFTYDDFAVRWGAKEDAAIRA